MKIFALCSLVLLGLSDLALGQNPQGGASSPSKPEVPAGPLLKAVGSFAQWEVAYSYPDDKKGKPATGVTIDPRPRRVVSTKTGETIHEETTDILGKRTDSWFKNGTQYRRNGTNPTWYESHPGVPGDTSYDPLPASGFRNLDWITPENFTGTVPAAEGHMYLVFSPGSHQKVDPNNPQSDKTATTDTIAYIDADTRLPVMARMHGETRLYRFVSAPSQMQALPDDLTDQIRKGEEARARAYQTPARPQ